MKHQSRRARFRRQYKENAKRFKKVNRQADEIRDRHDLCRHADERKIYRTIEERDNDQSPPLVCSDCDKRRLRIAVFVKASADLPEEAAQLVVSHFMGDSNG